MHDKRIGASAVHLLNRQFNGRTCRSTPQETAFGFAGISIIDAQSETDGETGTGHARLGEAGKERVQRQRSLL